jgi:hypothetical protein
MAMVGPQKSPSLMGKIGSVLLLLIGQILVGSTLLEFYRYAAIDVTALFGAIFGIGIIWGGAKLWQRWRIALGVICILYGLSGFTPLYLSQRNIQVASDVIRASILLGITLLVIGIILIFLQKRMDKITT